MEYIIRNEKVSKKYKKLYFKYMKLVKLKCCYKSEFPYIGCGGNYG